MWEKDLIFTILSVILLIQAFLTLKKDVELDISNSNQIKTKTKSILQSFIFILTQCETWGCLDEDRADILAGIDERHTRSSFSTALSLSLFLVFIEVRLEKLTSHRYVVENGSNVKIALWASMGNSLAAANQKLCKGRSAKLSLRPRSCFSSVRSSCSCKVMSFPTADAELNGSLTQSRYSVVAEEK